MQLPQHSTVPSTDMSHSYRNDRNAYYHTNQNHGNMDDDDDYYEDNRHRHHNHANRYDPNNGNRHGGYAQDHGNRQQGYHHEHDDRSYHGNAQPQPNMRRHRNNRRPRNNRNQVHLANQMQQEQPRYQYEEADDHQPHDVNEELLFQLSEIFIDANPNFLLDLCKNKSNAAPDELHRLVLQVFSVSDYPKSQQRLLEVLLKVLPDADPIYLLESLNNINSEDDLNEFIDEAMDTQNYPTLEPYPAAVKNNIGDDYLQDNNNDIALPNKKKRMGGPPLNQLHMQIIDLFPDIEHEFLQGLCGTKANTPANVDQLINIIFSMPDYPKSLARQLEILGNVLPDADDAYLARSVYDLHTEDEVTAFIQNALSTHQYPIKEGYIRVNDTAQNEPVSTANVNDALLKANINTAPPSTLTSAPASVVDATTAPSPPDALASTSTAPLNNASTLDCLDYNTPSTSFAQPDDSRVIASTSSMCPTSVQQAFPADNAIASTSRASTSATTDDYDGDAYLQDYLLSIPDLPISINDKLCQLVRILPDADPTYLLDKLKIIRDDGLNDFIAHSLEMRDYPKAKKQPKPATKIMNAYTNDFNIEKYLESMADPQLHVKSPSFASTISVKKDSIAYKHCLKYLLNAYLKYSHEYIERIFGYYNYNIIKTSEYLDGARQQMAGVANVRYADTASVLEELDNVPILQAIMYLQHKADVDAFVRRRAEAEELERVVCRAEGSLITCSVCFDEAVMPKEVVECAGGCIFCKFCLESSVKIAYSEGKLEYPCLAGCGNQFSMAYLKRALPHKMYQKISQEIQIAEIKAAGINELETCPFCDYVTIPLATDKHFHCLNEECMKESCRECREISHIPFKCNEVEKDEALKNRVYIENKMTEALVRKCRKCSKKIIKEEGCNKMTCACGAIMCYVCKKSLKKYDYTHFNGQGGSNFNLCPLWCDSDLLHQGAVVTAAEKALAEVGTQDLVHNPASGIRQYYDNLRRTKK